MYQFSNANDAEQAARLLASQSGCPVLVMQNTATRVLTIGLRSSQSIQQAGRHVGTVHASGQIEDYPCRKERWFRVSRCLCE